MTLLDAAGPKNTIAEACCRPEAQELGVLATLYQAILTPTTHTIFLGPGGPW